MKNRLARKSLIISISGILLLLISTMFGAIEPLAEIIGFVVMLWGLVTALSSLCTKTDEFGEKWYAVISLVLLITLTILISWKE
jgi:hypothetical protein